MRTVLIVNDDPDFLDAFAQMLELDDYRVATATNGDDALRLVATAAPASHHFRFQHAWRRRFRRFTR